MIVIRIAKRRICRALYCENFIAISPLLVATVRTVA